MPARPAYFHRIAGAIEILRRLPDEWIDRRTLEEVLGVSKTVAWRILRRCGAGEGPGNALVCRRGTLISALERLRETGEYELEIRRRERLEATLSGLLAVARAQHVPVAAPDRSLDLVNARFARLPPGIELTPGRLLIEFSGTQDFLQKVGAIVFMLQNDFEAVDAFLSTAQG